MNIKTLEQRLARLQDQAEQNARDQAPVIIRTCWAGQEDQAARKPGVKYIVTDWSNAPALEHEEKHNPAWCVV